MNQATVNHTRTVDRLNATYSPANTVSSRCISLSTRASQIREARSKMSADVDDSNSFRTISAIMKNDRSDESTAITGLRSTRGNGWGRAICLHVGATQEVEFVDELFASL